MRRSEFLSEEQEDFDYIVQNALTGNLGLVDRNDYPRIIPLNFGVIGKNIYFHGACTGEKYDLIKFRDKATFSIDTPFSFLPSYFSSKKSAVPTSHFFKSLHMRGKIVILESLKEKAKGLMSMMKKYQPEGKYVDIDPENRMYIKPLEAVCVFELTPNEITVKIKFGQNATLREIERIIINLQQRGEDLDLLTLEEIRKRSPHDLSHLFTTN